MAAIFFRPQCVKSKRPPAIKHAGHPFVFSTLPVTCRGGCICIVTLATPPPARGRIQIKQAPFPLKYYHFNALNAAVAYLQASRDGTRCTIVVAPRCGELTEKYSKAAIYRQDKKSSSGNRSGRKYITRKKAKLCIWCNNKGSTVIFVWTQLSAAGLIALFILNAPHTKCKYPHILPTNTNRSWLAVVMFCHITLEKFSAFNCTFARGNLPTIDGFPSQRLSDVKLFMFCRACLLLTNCWTKSICRWFETP